MKTITFELSQKSIKNAIKELKAYQKYLATVSNQISAAIAQRGYEVAERVVGNFNGIVFEIKEEKNGIAYLVGWSDHQIRTWWNAKGQIVNDDYIPILMAEYGSGRYAIQGEDKLQGITGRGTFPTETKNGKRNVWAWRDNPPPSELNFTSGEKPTRPMHNAYLVMAEELTEIVKQVLNEE